MSVAQRKGNVVKGYCEVSSRSIFSLKTILNACLSSLVAEALLVRGFLLLSVSRLVFLIGSKNFFVPFASLSATNYRELELPIFSASNKR